MPVVLLLLGTTNTYGQPQNKVPEPSKGDREIVLEFFPDKNNAGQNLPFEKYLACAGEKFPGRTVIAMIEAQEASDTTTTNKMLGRMSEYRMILPPKGKIKAPFFVVNGSRTATAEEKSVNRAVEESIGLGILRQPMKVEAWHRENRLKVNVTVNYKRFSTEVARLIIFVVEADEKNPVVRQIEDVGYLAPGHTGNSVHTFTLDKSWFAAKRGRSESTGLKVVALLQQLQTNKIFGASQTVVEKSRGGWY